MFEDFYAKLWNEGVVPVVIVERIEDAVPLAHALVAGGLNSAEVTFRTPCAAGAIATMRAAEPGMLVGAGTVVNIAQVDAAIQAGAQFVESPGLAQAVVSRSLAQGVPALPGAVTPTEIMAARAMGLEATKFFPAETFGGLSALKALAAPFAEHRFVPTGGVNAVNLAEYLAHPSIVACGGTWMVKPSLFADGDFSRVEELAREAAEIVRSVRQQDKS